MRTSVALSFVAGTLLTAVSFARAQAPQPPAMQPGLTQPPPPSAAPPSAAPPTPTPAPTPLGQPAPMDNPPSLPPPPVYTEPAPNPAQLPGPGFYAAPRAFVLSVGWSYTPTNTLPVAAPGQNTITPMGVNVDTGLLWKVRGYDGIRWPAWVGFMGGFLYYGGQNLADTYGLAYGIYVKHALFPGQRIRFFLGYGLGATQVWVRGLEGRGTGHYTRLSTGVDIHLVRWLYSTIEFSYRFFNLPTFKFAETDSGGYDFHALSLLAGFWIGR